MAREITNGIDAGRFGPDNPCDRAQMVTFLWRAAGSPEPEQTANSFTDVEKGSYYEKAVLWAVENGITNGTGGNLFSPKETVNRAQTVTFLYRFAGETAPAERVFEDVDPGAWYGEAVTWAAVNDITKGVDAAHFAPEDPCVRAQIVTFLHRLLQKG